MSAFEEFGLCPELIKAVDAEGWMLPSPVQAEAIPLILGGGDVMAAAETGSGKTGAFALPVLQIVHEALRQPHGLQESYPATGASGAAGVATAPCSMSTEDRDAIFAISPDGVSCQSNSQKMWGGGRAAAGVYSGRAYYEATMVAGELSRVGWSTATASLELGKDRHSFGYGGTGKKSHDNKFDPYGELFTVGDTIGCLLDCQAGVIAFAKNGNYLGPAFQIPDIMRGQMLYPTVCLKNSELQLNFGSQPFAFAPPPDYVPVSAASAASTSKSALGSSSGSSANSSNAGRSPMCVILEPSRDLAEQTHKCVEAFKAYLTAPCLSAVLLVGGGDRSAQAHKLKAGCDIITGTPGRILDFMDSGDLVLNQVKFFVLDEADRLIDNDEQAINKIFGKLPKSGGGINRLQVLLFSATLHSPEVKAMAAVLCNNPILVDLKGKDAVPETVDHCVVMVDPRTDLSWRQSIPVVPTDRAHALDHVNSHSVADSAAALSEAVKKLKPRVLQRILDTHKMWQCLIFCRTNFDCENLEQFFNTLGGGRQYRGKTEKGVENPYSCMVLAGGRSMEERRTALQEFKDGDVRLLICTDVAARGIDIKELPYVINMTLPDKSEDYVHRVGRVGRADAMGLAISIVAAVPEKVWYCTVKGYKPWLDPKAKDTKLLEQGGHTMMLNEVELLKAVEVRLGGQPIPQLGEDLSLPPHLKARLEGTGDSYGQQRCSTSTQVFSEHLHSIQQNVATLAALEWQAQTSFLTLKHRFTSEKSAS